LIVDDNEEFCQNLRDIVELGSYEVLTAYNGCQALEMVKNNGFDVVMMDVRMPVMDGVTTFRKIKHIAPQLPVVMVTAFAMVQLVREALREGAFGFLKKPVDFGRLFWIIENAVFKGSQVLVVDGDRDLYTDVEQELDSRGCKVVIASDEQEAIQNAWESHFDVMILDTSSSATDRLNACREILDIRPAMVVIVITGPGHVLKRPIGRVLEGTTYTCLEKPVNMEDIVLIMEKVVGKKARGSVEKSD
jgi:DNA-binding NtrC family response regulator